MRQYVRGPGFTLVETMIVIAIIAVLAGVAVPAYESYVIKSRVTNLIAAGTTAKKQLEEYMQIFGGLPICDSAPSITDTTVGITGITAADNVPYIDQLYLSHNCVVEIKGTSQLSPNLPGYLSVILCPKFTNGKGSPISWKCLHWDSNGVSGPWSQYLPTICQTRWNISDSNTCGH